MQSIHTLILSTLFITCLACAGTSTPETDTSTKEALMLQLDEERLAYQLYTALGVVHPELRQFQNIPRAEARHFQSLKNYFVQNYPEIEQLELEGDFIHPATKALYDRLYAEGKTSSAAALNVGVQVEELDIRDLDAALATTEDETLQAIYKRLRAGSERHLAAFSGNNRGPGKGRMNQQPGNARNSANCPNPSN